MNNALKAFQMSKQLGIKMNRQSQAQADKADQAQAVAPSTHNTTQNMVQETPKTEPVSQNPKNHQENTQTTPTATEQTAQDPKMDTSSPAEAPQVDTTSEAAVPDTKPAQAKPSVVPVDISIAGTHHRIVCPVGEVNHLETAATYINDKVRSIRQDIKGKVPTNEELLVLTCLEMYDQLKSLQDDEDYYTTERDEALTLIDKMLKNTKTAL